MTTEAKRIRIEPESELARLLDEAGEPSLKKNGELYRLTKAEAAKLRRRAKKMVTRNDYAWQ